MRLETFQIKNCFGFRDSGPVQLTDAHKMIYVLGRNSSGKTSLLRAIGALEYDETPQDYPNYINFSPTDEEPKLRGEFTLEKDDLSAEVLVDHVVQVYRRDAAQNLTKESVELAPIVTAIRDFYGRLIQEASVAGRVFVEKIGDGSFRFLPAIGSYEDYSARQSGITEALNQTDYPSTVNFRGIEDRLFYQFPKIFFFGKEYSLTDNLPQRITAQGLNDEHNPVEKAFISYLGPDTIRRFFALNDPDERDVLLRNLQDRVDTLCRRVNQHEGDELRNRDLISMVVHVKSGIQVTVKTDGKKSFYDHLSENTKFLVAYYLHHEMNNIAEAILLFDEPNTGFHSTAQEFVLNFLTSLADAGNTVVLSTHSEHMIDPDRLSGVRIMTTDQRGGLVVSNEFYQSARGQGDDLALQPILDAIGLRYGSQINIRNKVVITEGITDMLHLRAFKTILAHKARLSIAPARSESQILHLIPLFISQGITLKVLLDTGTMKKHIQKDFGIEDQYIWEVPVPQEFRDKIKGSGIEDLFSRSDFRKLLDHNGMAIKEDEFNEVSNSSYVRRRPAIKGILAHKLYESAGDTEIEFDDLTRENFKAALDFCAKDSWFSI